MGKRVCAEPGCPDLSDGTRCSTHARERDRARGTRQERGYDAAHEAERKRWSPIVATGNVKCARCRLHIDATEPWDLGHHDTDRTKHVGPEHVACNRATAAAHHRRIPLDAYEPRG